MSDFKRFMKQNKAAKENTTYAATKSLTDEEGKALLWEIRPVSTRENEKLKDECTREIPITGKPGVYREKVNINRYVAKLICASVVNPDLNNKELQDSYGVMGAEDLLYAIMDDPGEYGDLSVFVQEYNGFVSLQEKVDEAKN